MNNKNVIKTAKNGQKKQKFVFQNQNEQFKHNFTEQS